MTKPKPRPERPVDAVKTAIDREASKRQSGLKPIEIVKVAICAYLDHVNADAPEPKTEIESPDRKGLRRGTQASVDRMLFNANYWLAAYEDQIVATCKPNDASELLKALTVWSTHTLKLNTLGNDEVIATFERFCPPFAVNNRRGSSKSKGKGPIPQFKVHAERIAAQHPECADELESILNEMMVEAGAYESLSDATALEALYAILPVWCLQDKIGLVAGSWWDDAAVMTFIADTMKERFVDLGYGDVPCQYFQDSLYEAIDAYQRDISSVPAQVSSLQVPELLNIVYAARKANPSFETDGYDDVLPAWLVAKEQLIWNTLVCALYGPRSARPLLVTSPGSISQQSRTSNEPSSDIITNLAKASFRRYIADRMGTDDDRGFESFADQPVDLRNSSIEHIMSIPAKLEILGYEIVPDGSCYPGQRATSLSPSEIECLAVLEHRRWVDERTDAGWIYGETWDAEAKTSPYLVPWEELPNRAREWNRSAIRNIPALLAAENLAIARK